MSIFEIARQKTVIRLPKDGDLAVTNDGKNGFKAVYCCHAAHGSFRPKAHDSVMKVIHCLF